MDELAMMQPVFPIAPAPADTAGRWLAISCVVVAATVLSAFFGINEYASGTRAVVSNANNNHDRFEAIFGDLLQARYRTLNLAAETMLQSRVTVQAFARGDRADLVARMEPFFEKLHQTHGIEQLNFWLPPAKLYYRAGSPKEFGMDLSAFRKSIVAGNDRRTRISAIETGLGGVIALRAITPVFVDDKYIGVIEFVSNFDIPLERASSTSGMKWAVSLMKEVSERVERPADIKNDSWQGNDVYFHYSDPVTAQIVRAIRFDPRSRDHSLATVDGQTAYVKTFPLVNFSGVPTITVATVLDVTQDFAELYRLAAIKSAILFLLAAILGSVTVLRFSQIKVRLGAVLRRQKAELDERIHRLDVAMARLREVDLIKRGFFTNLVTAVNEPLQAVAGQLKPLPPAFAAAGASKPVVDRLQYALSETMRLSRLVEDYQQIEMFRQKLVKSDNPALSLAAVVAKTLEEDLAPSLFRSQRLISVAVPADLPLTRADGGLLRRAIAGLIGYAAQDVGAAAIRLEAWQDDAKWLMLSITGPAFAGERAPSAALLEQSRRLAQPQAGEQADDCGSLVSVVLARIIIEFYGGTLDIASSEDEPGFIVRLASAA
jgi:hypothetical protein